MSSVGASGAGQPASQYYAYMQMQGGGACQSSDQTGQSSQTDNAKHSHKHRHKHTTAGDTGDSGGLLEQLAQAIAGALQDSSSTSNNSNGNQDPSSDSSGDDDPNETIQTAVANLLSDEATGLTGRKGPRGPNDSIDSNGASSNGNSFLETLQQYGVAPEQFRNDFLAAAQSLGQNPNDAGNVLPPGSLLNRLS